MVVCGLLCVVTSCDAKGVGGVGAGHAGPHGARGGDQRGRGGGEGGGGGDGARFDHAAGDTLLGVCWCFKLAL
eukprot:3331573-Rhodomonas_salina.2